jgi:hypothetical protein
VLRILKEQMDTLAAKTRSRFVAKMCAYLREHFAACVDEMSADELTEWVGDAVAAAEKHGVTTEPEVAQLVLLYLVIGLDADETTPWAAEALRDRDLVGVGKVRRLARLAREHGVAGVEEVLVVREVIEA